MTEYLLLSLFMAIISMVVFNVALELFGKSNQIHYSNLVGVKQQAIMYASCVILWPIALPFFVLGVLGFIFGKKDENN